MLRHFFMENLTKEEATIKLKSIVHDLIERNPGYPCIRSVFEGDDSWGMNKNEYQFHFANKKNGIRIDFKACTEEYWDMGGDQFFINVVEVKDVLMEGFADKACLWFRSRKGGYTEKPYYFTVGGYSFEVNGKTIPFDYVTMYGWTTIDDEGFIIVEADVVELDCDVFGETWHEDGISFGEVTTKCLTKPDSIGEIYYECYADADEKEFIFMDCIAMAIEGVKVSKEKLHEYRARIIEEDKEYMEG